jgi:hypothetical protein
MVGYLMHGRVWTTEVNGSEHTMHLLNSLRWEGLESCCFSSSLFLLWSITHSSDVPLWGQASTDRSIFLHGHCMYLYSVLERMLIIYT